MRILARLFVRFALHTAAVLRRRLLEQHTQLIRKAKFISYEYARRRWASAAGSFDIQYDFEYSLNTRRLLAGFR